jgi:hypothetical protein
MRFNKESAVERAKEDLAERAGVAESDIEIKSVNEKEFTDMSLGASAVDEMAAQMLVSGWQINLGADGKDYEYRADKYQLRLVGFDGTNHIIES